MSIILKQLRTADPESMANDLAFVVEALIRTARLAIESEAEGSAWGAARVLGVAEVLTQLLGEGCERLEAEREVRAGGADQMKTQPKEMQA